MKNTLLFYLNNLVFIIIFLAVFSIVKYLKIEVNTIYLAFGTMLVYMVGKILLKKIIEDEGD